MKLFTLTEANELLPGVSANLKTIQKLYAKIDTYRDAARSAAVASEFGGGMKGGSQYVKALYEIGKITTELYELGVQLKDYSRGLIDFPSMRDGRVVLLCWQLGEDEQIEWWHELETGFAGRQPL
jgi:hypothetical protein